ncbi:DUF305 domain-containing protein [Streptomyces sp. RFCAC02]|uniref:DUF305 domain-containing protein n=1 Tax=Streptomyces sp. RFCAC02 TaxID=2499143 RepID=UPI00102054A7|nr:DUF305 domain-containing protein [Streptomyces sp. RFCAC02]
MTAHRSPQRRAARFAAGAALVLLTACGGGDGAPAADATLDAAGGPEPRHNAADAAFLRAMIPLHREAVELAGLAPGRAATTDVDDLAGRVVATQEPEIATMTDWLADWDEPAPDPGAPGDDAVDELSATDGEAFDAAFLTLMIDRHETAVDLAGTELSGGVHEPARELAEAVITTRTAEIGAMTALLNDITG